MRIKWQFFVFTQILLYHVLYISAKELDRLSYRLKPEKYKLTIIVSMVDETTKYSGSVRIKIYCEQSTSLIVVNQSGFEIDPDSVWVRPFTESEVKIGLDIARREPVDRDKYEIEMVKKLVEKKYYEIEMQFSKTFPKKPEHATGFLLMDNYFAFTKFHELEAKSVFPCLDQVDMKAKYQIILRHRDSVKGLTNSDLDSFNQPSNQPQWMVEEFKETENLSTFSIAFVLIRSLEKYKEKLVDTPEVKIRIRTYKDIEMDTAGVHEIVCDVFEFYTKIFTLPYSLGKLDVFVATNMSLDTTGHYGFIYMSPSEASLIFTEDKRTRKQHKYEAFSKLCRSISQQWIGNIVTMSNWYETWLSEGFNYFFQVQCVNKFNSELEYRFSVLEMIDSFVELLDMAREGRYNQISEIPVDPQFKFNKFNELTKNKINVLVRMMDFILGSDIFKASINRYLEHFKFSNLKIDDIWQKFTETIEMIEEVDEAEADKSKIKKQQILPPSLTIKQIMESWTTEIDIPLITVTKTEGENEITITQEVRPLLYKHKEKKTDVWDMPKEPTKQCWNILLSLTTNVAKKFKEPSVREWLTCNKDSLTLQIPRLSNDVWYIINTKMKVLASFNYDTPNWLLIQKTLREDDDNYSGLDVVARTQLVSDLFMLAEVGKVSYTILFDTMKYLSREKEYPPWKVALKEFKKIWTLLLRTDILIPFEAYVRDILEPIFDKNKYHVMVNFSFKDKVKYQMKILFMEFACKFGMEACKRNCKAIRHIWKKHPEKEFSEEFPLRINEIVHCEGVKDENMLYRRRLRNRYRQTYPHTSDYEATVIFTALGCATRTDILERYVKLTLNENYVSYYNNFKIFKSLTSNKKGYPIMKTFLKNNIKKIAKYYNNDPFDIVKFYEVLLDVTNTEKDMEELMKFARDSKRVDMSLPRLHASEERAKYNIKWLKDNEYEFKKYFNVPEQPCRYFSRKNFCL